jgi:AraC-like DNA-binding protein
MGMSRMQLFRKLKALVNQTPSELIRNIRLQRAAQLIKQRYGNVAEVTYEVGFNNLSYFAKCFKEKYGLLPSEYQKQMQG